MGLKRLKLHNEKKKYSMRQAAGQPYLYDFSDNPDGEGDWYRNPSWIAMPTVSNTEEKWVSLISIDDTTENYLRMYVAGTGEITIDWGDGTIEVFQGSPGWRYHQYDGANAIYAGTDVPVVFGSNVVTKNNHGYTDGMRISFAVSDISDVDEHVAYFVVNATTNNFQLATTANGTPISIGSGTGTILPYKQTLLQVTAVSDGVNDGAITSINFNSRHPTLSAFSYPSPHREIRASLPSHTAVIYYGDENQQQPFHIEKIDVNFSTNYTNAIYMHRYMHKLREINIDFDNTTIIDASYMFYICRGLKTIPDFNATLNGRTQNMFNACHNLRKIPKWNSVTNTNNHQPYNAFSGCYHIKRIPQPEVYTTFASNTTNLSSYVSGCYNLIEEPYIDLSQIQSASYSLGGLFNATHNVGKSNYINTGLCNGSLNSFYAYSFQRKFVPTIDISTATSLYYFMFYSTGMDYVKFYNGPNNAATTAGLMFYESGIVSVGDLSIPNATTIDRMNYNSHLRLEIGEITTSSALTNCYQAFHTTNISSINLFDTSNVTNMGYTFNGCYVLKEIPAFDTSNVTTALGFALACTLVKKIGTTNWPVLTDGRSMFYNLHVLEEMPSFNFPEVTDCENLFRNNYILRAGNISVPKSTDIQYMFNNCKRLERLYINAPLATTGAYALTDNQYGGWNFLQLLRGDLSAMGDNQLVHVRSVHLKKLLVTHTNSVDLRKLGMSAGALDEFYTYLPTVSGKTINITGTRGAGDDTPSIATAKGWTVTG
jgi:hypothetical protein